MKRLLAAMLWIGGSLASGQEASTLPIDNWAQWRGPNADGVAPHGDPPIKWDATTNVKWKVAIPGEGSGTPIVWRDRIFLLTAIDTGREPGVEATAGQEAVAPEAGSEDASAGRDGKQERGEGRGGGRRGGGGLFGFGAEAAPTTVHRFDVICLDRNTGEVVWQKTAIEAAPHEGRHGTNTFASASAVTDGKLLIASFGSRGIFCYDLDGNFKWSKDLGDMQTRRGFGEGATPALYGDALVVPWDQETGSFIVCLDANTGDERWRKERDEVTTWNTPRIVEHDGRVQAIVNASNRARSYDLATGEVLWECGGQATNPIASPVILDDLAICMTGFRGYAVYAVPLDSTGDLTGTDTVRWSRTDVGPYVASPLLYDDMLYFTKGDQGILCAVNATTGESPYGPKRVELGQIYASPVGAAGRVYLTDRAGTTIVFEHGPEFKQLAENKIDETVNASLAIVGNEIFLRGDKHLYCIAAP